MAWARQPPVPPRAGGGATLLTVPGERWEGRDRGIHSSGSLNSSPEANGDDTGPKGTTRETGGAQGGGSGDAAPLPTSTLPFRNDFSGQGSNWVASLGTEKIPEDVTRAGTSALRAGKGRQASRRRRQAGPHLRGGAMAGRPRVTLAPHPVIRMWESPAGTGASQSPWCHRSWNGPQDGEPHVAIAPQCPALRAPNLALNPKSTKVSCPHETEAVLAETLFSLAHRSSGPAWRSPQQPALQARLKTPACKVIWAWLVQAAPCAGQRHWEYPATLDMGTAVAEI